MAVCVRMVGQELRACVQYRPPLQCSRQRCTGPRRAVPQQPALGVLLTCPVSMWLVAGGGECRAVLLSDPLILLQPSSNRLLSEASFVPV